MPRVKPLTQAQEQEKARQQYAKRIPCNIAYYMQRAGIRSRRQLSAKLTTMSRSTFDERMNRPEGFSLEQLIDVARQLGVTLEELTEDKEARRVAV